MVLHRNADEWECAVEHRIETIVQLYFEDIPYCEEVRQAQSKIKAIMVSEYRKLAKETNQQTAFETIVEKYAKLSDMAVLAGYTEQEVVNWRLPGKAKELKPLKKEITCQKRMIYLISALMMFTVFYALNIIVYKNFWSIAMTGTCGVLAGWLLIKFRRREARYTVEKVYDTEAYSYLRTLSDRYAKRRINGIAIYFVFLSYFVINFVSFFAFGELNLRDLIIVIFANFFLIEISSYVCIKNTFCYHLIQRRINRPERTPYQKHLHFITGFSAVYWTIVAIAEILLRSATGLNQSLYFRAVTVLFLLLLLYNLTLRKRITFHNRVFNAKRVVLFASIALTFSLYSYMQRDTWYTQPYINSIAKIGTAENHIFYDDETGIYTITAADEDFKILQLTDIHLGGSLFSYPDDLLALKAIYAEIEHTKPDLVVVTGDLTMPMGVISFSLNNSAPVGQFAALMRNIGIPWVFTYGNHDTESVAATSETDLDNLYQSLSYKTSGTLLYPYIQPQITGRNNQLVEIRNADGSLNQALFLLDSNAYTGEGLNDYDYIHDDQVDWYADEVARLSAEEGKTISSMVFFHIPLQQYRTAYELYEEGSDQVKYFFGENGEKMFDTVCCSDYPSNLFATMVKLGSTEATFCGHDHYNNMSLEYQGIRLTYGMSIDYLAMPGIDEDTAQRGATLITLHADGTWQLEQVPLTSITP